MAFGACSTTAKPPSTLTTTRNPAASGAEVATDTQVSAAFFAEYEKAAFFGKDPFKAQLKVAFKWIRQKPIPLFKALRAEHPVFTISTLPIKEAPFPNRATVIVSRYKDVVEVLNHPQDFSVRDYTKKMQDSVGSFMLASDQGPANAEKPWMREMMPHSDREKIKNILNDQIKNALREGIWEGTYPNGQRFARLEVVNQLARRVSVRFTGEYFGFPGPDEESMFRWSHATQDDYFHNVINDPKVHERAVQAGTEMKTYISNLITEKRRHPDNSADDILSRMIRSGHANELQSYSDDRIGANILGTLIGGVETTEAAVVQALDQLLKRPVEFAAARQAALDGNEALLSRYVWEALRFNPVNPFVVRYAERDYTIENQLIKKGSIVLVATQSAMFDERVVANPDEFSVDPGLRPDSVYFHLGFGIHRCLGDYVSTYQVPLMVKSLLLKKNLRRASGDDGQILKTPKTASFPEKFYLEFDPENEAKVAGKIAVQDPAFAFEDYLNDYDPHVFRECMAGEKKYASIPDSLNKIFHPNERKGLFWCRLKFEFRSCILAHTKADHFFPNEGGLDHERALAECQAQFPLKPAEEGFYKIVMMGKKLDWQKLPTDQAARNHGKDYDFENYLKYYNRFNYWACFLNPLGISSFPNDRDLILYARLNRTFRFCMGLPVVEHEISYGILGKSRIDQYEKCKDGLPDKTTGVVTGALSRMEKYYYQNLILGQKISFDQIDE